MSLFLNAYLIYLLIDRGITYSYTLDSNKYLKKDMTDTVQLISYIFKESSRNEIELLGSKLASEKSIFFKKEDKSCTIGALKFLFDEKDIVKDIIYN